MIHFFFFFWGGGGRILIVFIVFLIVGIFASVLHTLIHYLVNEDCLQTLFLQGKVLGFGTYDELSASGVDFAAVIKQEEDETNQQVDDIPLETDDIQLSNLKSRHNLSPKLYGSETVSLLSESGDGEQRKYKSNPSLYINDKLRHTKHSSHTTHAISKSVERLSYTVVDPAIIGSVASLATLDSNFAVSTYSVTVNIVNTTKGPYTHLLPRGLSDWAINFLGGAGGINIFTNSLHLHKTQRGYQFLH